MVAEGQATLACVTNRPTTGCCPSFSAGRLLSTGDVVGRGKEGTAETLRQGKRIMHTYDYELVDGHIVAIATQLRLLIDTGAPSSVGDASPLSFAGGSYPIRRNYTGEVHS